MCCSCRKLTTSGQYQYYFDWNKISSILNNNQSHYAITICASNWNCFQSFMPKKWNFFYWFRNVLRVKKNQYGICKYEHQPNTFSKVWWTKYRYMNVSVPCLVAVQIRISEFRVWKMKQKIEKKKTYQDEIQV